MAALDEPDVFKRMVLAYAADLVTAISVVLICGRLLMPWPDIATNPILSDDLLAAIGRFTPFGLWQVYQDTLLDALRNFSHHEVAGPLPALLLGLRTILLFILAVPQALLAAYWQSDGIQTWVPFAAALFTICAFGLVLSSGRPSPARLLVAVMLSPVLTSIVFWLTQQTLLDAVAGLAWFARMAPWCLPCPVVCTLWWLCFPRASHGATASLVLFLQHRWAARARRPAIKP